VTYWLASALTVLPMPDTGHLQGVEVAGVPLRGQADSAYFRPGFCVLRANDYRVRH
jgi:hypothetical protein